MDQQGQKRGSFLPLLFIGLITVFFLQYLGNEPPSKSKPQSEAQSTKQDQNKPQAAKKPYALNSRAKNDFQFPRAAKAHSSRMESSITTDKFFVILSRRGGRIKHFYVKSHDKFLIPQQVITESKDPIAKEHRALEITQGLGMDFQPHLYYYGRTS